MKKLSLVVGIVLVSIVVAMALVSLVWTPFDPTRVVPAEALQKPSRRHIMGTDGFGIDIFSRILAGSRIVMLVGVIAVGIAAVLGTPLGMFAGMVKGWPGTLVQRATDILFAFPALLLAILLAAAVGGSTTTGMVAIGIATIPVFARLARAGTLQVMSQDYVLAARSAGTPWLSVARRHVWPNIAPLIGVQASVSFGMAILAEASLSYLGLATPPTVPTWGRMLFDAQKFLFNAPNLTVWPALAIALAVLGFNVLGDGLRDHLDPRLREVS
ncbi:MAG TPA: ABC transporter permease [Propionibacteriaceae bacterium]|nr:ABC transporter permease [Propionibacteriaceae bacterium]